MRKLGFVMFVALTLTGCQDDKPTEPASPVAPPEDSVASNPQKNAYFGDTHVHTMLSMDAYIFGTRRTPDDAYLFGKGGVIEHASGFVMKMKKPLDFVAVTDHGMYLGIMRELEREGSPYASHEMAPLVKQATDYQGSLKAMGWLHRYVTNRTVTADPTPDELDDRNIAASAWQEIIESAERHNDPGNFTTFIGYEFTTTGPTMENLHRNVIFRGSNVPEQLHVSLDSLNPEDLWRWMDGLRERGIESLAIPHNSNGSDGLMFQKTTFAGDPMDADYAELRMRNEPLVENTQIKGTSDTHPMLSPNDEWADFEIMPYEINTPDLSRPPGSYVREAYLNGMVMQETAGFNPYKFGVIGASDTHNGAGSFEEDNYWGKLSRRDIEPYRRGSVPLPDSPPEKPKYATGAPNYWGASGLAGVWAESNTRDAIYDAFRRKETFSTSGPHIKVRFFGSTSFDPAIVKSSNAVSEAYANGVTMGSDLDRSSTAPSFFVWAMRDPDAAPLQRLQIIKGWIEDGEPREMVYDVACSDGGTADPKTHRCPDNGATVDIQTCEIHQNVGDPEMKALWQDPEFNQDQHAFYYARVLENPKCRWSTWDAIRAGVVPREDLHTTLQDRAWSSPIWYNP
ncbi:MAG: DUF3604 domain-containing protein [Gammaproteobacteria bacterium]|nr:DUF3604 domain-containing protein [Gammaproteobacteria bacterium]